MRFYKALPLTAALARALVIPPEEVANQLVVEDNRQESHFSSIKHSFENVIDTAKDAFDAAVDDASAAADTVKDYVDDFSVEDWTSDFNYAHEADFDFSIQEEAVEDAIHDHWHRMKEAAREWRHDLGFDEIFKGPPIRGGPDKFRKPYGDSPSSPFPPGPPGPPEEHDDHHHHPPGDDKHKPPHHEKPPHHGKPPHHKKPHHHKPNQTVYQLISKSKYTTKLTKLIDEFPDVVAKLNGTEANFTIFAPTDKAFEKIPKHGQHPPKEFLLKILQYHVVPDVYPAGRVLKSRTLPTVLEGTGLTSDPKKNPQRLSVNLSFKGLTINFYSRVVAINIFGTNGVIHGVDSILVPPPKAAKIIQFLPGEFSTLELGLLKTGLFSALNDTSNHLGGTIFAPSNSAWEKLGPKATGFLFSKYGRKYLKALLEYHIAPNVTLYSDELYTSSKDKAVEDPSAQRTFHIDLPTLLKDKYLSIDVARFARFVDIRINGFNHVAVTDGIVKDGVIHAVGSVIVPPKSPGGESELVESDMDVHELVQRLEPFTQEMNNDEIFDYEFLEEKQNDFNDIPLEL